MSRPFFWGGDDGAGGCEELPAFILRRAPEAGDVLA